MYVRVAVTNNGTAAVTVPPGGSGPNLIQLTSHLADHGAARRDQQQ